MNTRTKKKNTIAASKAISAKKKAPRKKSASLAPVGKISGKSTGKEEKSALSKKTASKSLKLKKKIPAGQAPVASKTTAKKIRKKPAEANKERTTKKKLARPVRESKTEAIKPVKPAAPKASQATKKSSRKTERKIKEKIKVGRTSGTKKKSSRLAEPALQKKERKAGGPAKSREKKSASRVKGKDEFDTPPAQLPDEYGENELILMAVDPNVIFADWEIKKEEAPEERGGLTMRVFEVTAGKPVGLLGDIFFDIKIEDRVGCGFFELGMPGREVAVEIGFCAEGKFLPILRSQAVSMPQLLVPDELGIVKKLFESGIPVGY